MRLTWGVLAAAGWLAFMAKRGLSRGQPPEPRDCPDEHACTAKHGSEPAGHDQPLRAAPLPSPDERQYASDERHKRGERIYWRVTGAASVVATIAAGAAAWFAYGAFTETRRQADTAQEALIAADRPWIKVLGLSAPEVEIRDGGVFLNARLSVKNIGRSPAQHTHVRARLQADGSAIDEARDAEAFCREAAVRGIPFVESLIFPDDDRALAVHALADVRIIAQHWRDRIERDFQMARSAFGDDPVAERRRAERLSYPVRVGLTLIGCITYVIPTGRSYGQTAFIYGFNRNCGLGPYGECSFEMEEEGTHEGDALVMREAIGGAFAR